MKKLTALSSLFLFVFGLAAGITIATHEPAQATTLCEYECLGFYECTWEMGPNCTSNPRIPYYKYFVPTCLDGPLDCTGTRSFVGCCAHLSEV